MFKLYFISRIISGFGDSVWLIALPLFVLRYSNSPLVLGQVTAMGAAGILIASYSVAHALKKMRASKLAFISDLLQASAFIILFFTIHIDDGERLVRILAILNFFIMFFQGFWYVASEVMLTRITINSMAQQTHRWNYFSSSAGPLLGAMAGGFLFEFMGIKGILILNIISFIAQIIILKNLAKMEAFDKKTLSSKSTSLIKTAKTIFSHPLLRVITFIPVFVQFSLVGILPFVSFVLAKVGTNKGMIGLVSGTFGVGSLVGAFTFKPLRSVSSQGLWFFIDSLIMFIAIFLLTIFLKTLPAPSITAGCLFISGVFSARYTIHLRSIRQQFIDPSIMSDVISFQAVVARCALPLSGLVLGILLSPENPPLFLFIFLGLLSTIGALLSLKVAKVSRSLSI